MEDLIYALPTLIIFFIILFKIFSFFKRAVEIISKKFNLTIEEADQESKRKNKSLEIKDDQNELEKRIAEAEKESAAESEKRFLNNSLDSKKQEKKLIKENIDKIKNKELRPENRKNKSSSLGKIFSQYNELEKAVIYHEILSKPKALKKD